jgi:predicted PurR-regulated permease PerM
MTTSSNSFIKTVFVLLLVFTCLHFAKDFLIPIVISGVIATIFSPFCQWMEKKGISRGLATLISLLILLLFIAGINSLVGWQISELTKDIELVKQRIIDIFDHIQKYIFNNYGVPIEKQSQFIKGQGSSFTWLISNVAESLTSTFTKFILTLVYIFCLLYYRNHIKTFLLKLSPSSQRPEMEKVVYRVANVSQQYMWGLAKMILCLWIMYFIGFSIVGVKNALFFAILCGLLEIVPFIGNITGTTITVLVATVQGAGTPMVLGIVGTYGVVQFIQGWILEPLILGPQVKINPLFTIIALVIGEMVWGIAGIFLAIPLMAMIKIIFDHIEPLKPYGFLIGEIETKKKKESDFIKKVNKWYK